MQRVIICPCCRQDIGVDLIAHDSCKCDGGHEFPVVDGIIDLLPNIENDKNLQAEEQYWNNAVEKGWPKSLPNPYMDKKIIEDCRAALTEAIKNQWPDYRTKNVIIGEIGCGSGSAISYLNGIEFPEVWYIGTDISLKMLQLARNSPGNWKTQLVRVSGNIDIFKESSLDIIFSISVLNHFKLDTVIHWISKALKPGGLFVLVEPSARNIFARIGRKLITHRSGFFYTSDKRILPSQVEEIASNYDLELAYEKGLHFLVSPLYYFLGIFNIPKLFTIPLYYAARMVDLFIASPSWNYTFIQAYKKVKKKA
jgi:SAM-dependent methyltransferase